MKITWHGTASIEIENEGRRLFLDPFMPLRGSTTQLPPDVYDDARNILITHGHFDHIGSMAAFKNRPDCRVYCTGGPAVTLEGMGIAPERIRRVAPGEKLEIAGFEASVFQGRHIKYDVPVVLRTVFRLRFWGRIGQAARIFRQCLICKEYGETCGWLLEASDRRVFVLGSLGLDSDTEYPTDVDVLVLPYQGCSRLLEPALEIVEKIKPRMVFADHFDDTFPPISSDIDTAPLAATLEDRGIPFIKPEAGKAYLIP